jgi:MFS family permease
MKHPSWKSEFLGLYETFFTDPYILALFPMFLASNWFYAYHFTDINGAYFNLRTRALNNVCYYIFQIIGAYTFGFALDYKGLRRTVRAKIALFALFALIMVIYGLGYKFQLTYDRAFGESETAIKKDWTHSGYLGPFFLYIFYGFTDAAWQTCVYWYVTNLQVPNRSTC